MRAKAHKAYHSASQGLRLSPDAQDAIELVPQLNELATKFLKRDNNKEYCAHIKDTIAWILIRLGDRLQQDEGRRIINALLNDDDIARPVRERLKQNYDKIGERF